MANNQVIQKVQDSRKCAFATDATMGRPCTLVIHPTNANKPIKEITIQGSKITTVNFSIDDRFIYTGHDDGTINAWDPNTGDQLKSSKEHSDSIRDFQFSADKTFFITASKDTTAKLFDAYSLTCNKTYKTERPVNSAAISPTRDEVVLGGGQDAMNVTTTSARAGKFECRFFNACFEDEIGRVKGHFGPINTLEFHPAGTGFASGAEDGFVRLHEFDASYYEFSYDD